MKTTALPTTVMEKKSYTEEELYTWEEGQIQQLVQPYKSEIRSLVNELLNMSLDFNTPDEFSIVFEIAGYVDAIDLYYYSGMVLLNPNYLLKQIYLNPRPYQMISSQQVIKSYQIIIEKIKLAKQELVNAHEAFLASKQVML